VAVVVEVVEVEGRVSPRVEAKKVMGNEREGKTGSRCCAKGEGLKERVVGVVEVGVFVAGVVGVVVVGVVVGLVCEGVVGVSCPLEGAAKRDDG